MLSARAPSSLLHHLEGYVGRSPSAPDSCEFDTSWRFEGVLQLGAYLRRQRERALRRRAGRSVCTGPPHYHWKRQVGRHGLEMLRPRERRPLVLERSPRTRATAGGLGA